MKKIIGIIDYEMGNLFSVTQACKKIGLEVQVVKDFKVLKNFDAIILPGVGSFKTAVENIHKLGLYNEIVNFSKEKPVMGICLGFQLLFDSSTEFGKTKGLGIVKGQIVKFNKSKVPRIPHMGWNTLSYINHYPDNPLRGIEKDELYFVHSYFAETDDQNIILSKTKYEDFEFISSIQWKNVFGTQFHPEKSGEVGLNIYKNWAEIHNLL